MEIISEPESQFNELCQVSEVTHEVTQESNFTSNKTKEDVPINLKNFDPYCKMNYFLQR